MIIRFCDDGFHAAWESLAAEDLVCPPLFTAAGVALEVECHRHRGVRCRDLSFIVASEKHEPLAGVRLAAMEFDDGPPELSAYGHFATCLKAPAISPRAVDEFLKELMNVCAPYAGSTLKFRDGLERGTLSVVGQQLLADGAAAKPRFTRMVDLSPSQEQLASARRRRYKNFVAWGEKNLRIEVMSADSADAQLFEQCRLLHVREAGRETRSKESWALQLERIRLGEAYAVTGWLKGELVSFGYFAYHRRAALYYSSASRRDLDAPLFHALLWRALLHAKSLGCEYFEIGGLLYAAVGGSLKEIQIAQFKSGFGGETRVYLDFFHQVVRPSAGDANS